MSDSRTYIKLDDHFDENEKVELIGESAAWLYVVGLCYCSRNLTDGMIPKTKVPKMVTGRVPQRTEQLIAHGLWIDRGNKYEVHDYLEHQRSRGQIENERQKARERAAKSRRTYDSTSYEVQQPEAVSEAKAVAVLKNSRSKNREATVTPNSRPSGNDLIARMAFVCKNQDSNLATKVVDALTDHVDELLIDECIGFAAALDMNSRPNDPRYFLKAVREWAKDRGLAVPDVITLRAAS